MFENELKEKFMKIFNVEKVTFDQPSEAGEQGCIFVEVEDAKSQVRDGQVISRVTGNAFMIAQNDKMPFLFFSKAIARAPRELTKDFFFFDFESNTKRYRNLVQRGFSFTYFFRGQYDPDMGTITSVELITTEE